MNRIIKTAVTVLASLATLSAMAEDDDKSKASIQVEAAPPVNPTESVVEGNDPARPVATDSGEVLTTVPGVSGSRLGGHGLEPYIRGQSQNRINVLIDGGNVYGACPNRMDPPTAYVAPTMFDKITVIKGTPEGLMLGSGATGGTVLFEREAPGFTEPGQSEGKAGVGYRNNGNVKSMFADYAMGGPKRYLRFLADHQDADNYVDGDGNEIRSAFTNSNFATVFGYSPDAMSDLKLDLDLTRGSDILYEGAGMDTPETSNNMLKLKYDRRVSDGWVKKWSLQANHSDIHHVMDNYSLRTPPAMASMWMEVPSDSRTSNIRLTTDLATSGDTDWSAGVEYRYNNRDATRYSGATLSDINSYMWPDVRQGEAGLFTSYKAQLGERARLNLGGRLDIVSAEAAKANATTSAPMTLNPNALYNLYYGQSAAPVSENNVSLSAKYERDFEESPSTWFASLSRVTRTADATERFMAANGMTTDMRWIGNPGILPEKHNELELGIMNKMQGGSFGGSVFYNRVNDYILRDRAHGQTGILQNDDANIYRNVEAELYGAELEGNVNWSRVWGSRLTAAYVVATNTTDDRPIAQIPPLEVTASLDYGQAKWKWGGKVRLVAAQTRVDDDPSTGSGLDLGPSEAFSLLDLYGNYQISKRSILSFGVDNAFNVTYAEHLNRYNPMDPTPVKVNEPGRSLWFKAVMEL